MKPQSGRLRSAPLLSGSLLFLKPDELFFPPAPSQQAKSVGLELRWCCKFSLLWLNMNQLVVLLGKTFILVALEKEGAGLGLGVAS